MPKVHSNAVIESHFRQLKVTTLQNRTRLRPGKIVRQELTNVHAKLNNMWLAEAVTGREMGTKKSCGRNDKRKRTMLTQHHRDEFAGLQSPIVGQALQRRLHCGRQHTYISADI